MFFEQTQPYLEYFALLFANIAAFLFIILLIVAIFIFWSLKSKINQTLDSLQETSLELQEKSLETMDAIQDATYNVIDNGFSFFNIASFMVDMMKTKKRKKKKTIFDFLGK